MIEVGTQTGAVVFVHADAYQRFLREFDQAQTDIQWTHLKTFDGDETVVDFTCRIHDGVQTLTLAARTQQMLGEDLLLAVNLSQAETSRRSTQDIIEAAGLEQGDALDLITGHPVADWFDPVVPGELRVAFDRWTNLGRPSALIVTRADLDAKHEAGKFVLRSVPPAMRLATPILVVTELVADEFDRILAEHGIDAIAMNSVLVLTCDGHVRESFRTTRTASTERTLTTAVGTALSWVGEQLNEVHALVESIFEDEDEVDTLALRSALEEAQTRERALGVQLANARAEVKDLTGQRWALNKELAMRDGVQACADVVEEKPLAVTPQPSRLSLPELTETTFRDMVPHARERFAHLSIDSGIDKLVLPLESHPKRDIWLLRAWTSLALLDCYAERPASDPATFRAWLEVNRHPLIRPSHVRSGETASMRTGKYRRARTFVVPPTVDPSGRAMFLTHIHIEPGKTSPNPRLHYLDDTAERGKIYVGHLGPHLTSRRTN